MKQRLCYRRKEKFPLGEISFQPVRWIKEKKNPPIYFQVGERYLMTKTEMKTEESLYRLRTSTSVCMMVCAELKHFVRPQTLMPSERHKKWHVFCTKIIVRW